MKKHGFCTTLLMSLLATSIYAQEAPRHQRKKMSMETSNKVFGTRSALSGWIGDNKTYQAIRYKIDKQIAQGASPSLLALQNQSLARPKPLAHLRPEWQQIAGVIPQDSHAVFAWAYATRRVALMSSSPNYQIMGHPFEAMKHLKNLQEAMSSYDFARLYFLIASRLALEEPDEKTLILGERLYRSNSNDNDVRYLLIRDLMMPESATNTQRSVVYAQEWVKQDPNSADAHVLLAGAFNTRWVQTQKVEYADLAIREFKSYLNLDPHTEYKARIQYKITVLSKYK